jgi:phospholipid/cholesterol/gamma-HCH transport system substrate-binding protein
MPSSQRVKWAKFRVSAVSLVAILILLTLVYLLTGGTLLSQKAMLYLYLPDGDGLERDAPVRVDGVDVGKVKAVELAGVHDPNREVRVTMEVERGRLAGIPANSEAEISSDSMIGDRFVDVTSHPAPATVRAGGEIRLKKSTDVMKAIDIRDLEKQLLQFDAVLQDLEAGRGPVGEFVQGRQMYTDLVKRSAEIEGALKAAVAATTTVGQALYQDRLYRQFLETVTRVDDTLSALQSGQGDAGRLLRDSAQYDELQQTLRGIRQSAADLRAAPMLRSDEAYAGWTRSLAALIRQVDDLNSDPAFNTSEAYDSLAGMAQELRESVRDFRTHPEKYLRMKVF